MKEMPTAQGTRINLTDLKSQICRRLGPDRAERYFSYLSGFLGQKLSKAEFDKLCLEALGRENVHLHNQLIHSIFKNASQAKVPPPAFHGKSALKPCKVVEKKSHSTDDVLTSSLTVKSNGPILPPSPRKCRSTNTRNKDRPSPLAPNGTHAFAYQLHKPPDEAGIRENGAFVTRDYEQEGLAELPRKKQRLEKPLPHDGISVHSRDSSGMVAVGDVEDVKQTNGAASNRAPLCAPLGIPFCPASTGGARRVGSFPVCSTSAGFASYYDRTELCHTEALRKRMEQIVVGQGLEGVTLDCANLLNNGLDAYLKQLISSSVKLVAGTPGQESIKHPDFKQRSEGKIVNGIWPGSHLHLQRSIGPLEGTRGQRSRQRVSMLDFRVAMELNPQQLGEDWPLLLEKVYFRCFEE